MASSGTSDISYCINQVGSIEGLKSLIHSKLDELGFHSRCDQVMTRIGNELKAEDKKSREITKKFDEGASILESLMMDLHAYGDEESDNEDLTSIPSISVASDDDEIMVVDSNASSFTGPTSNTVSRPFQSLQPSVRTVGSGQNPPFSSGQSLILVNESGQQIRAVVTSMNSTNNNQMLHSDGGPGQAPILSPLAHQATPRAMTVLNQPSPKPPELAAGMKLYAKKFNDIWYKGALIEIQSRDRPFSERKFKIKFDGKGMKVIGSKSIAYTDHPKDTLLVGSRVIAMYKDDEHSTHSFYAGIIAEPPSLRNNNRYLVFFDDGYAQYSVATHLHQVCDQSKQVWEDIHPDSQEFIKGYLQQYPERPMVRLHPGQTIKTEWKGNWWVAKVQEVDASLVKMYFESDKRVEWIYRGSTRLEPLYTELANAEASRHMGKGRRRGNLNPKGSKKPFVEYTRCLEEPVPKKLTLPNQTIDHTLRADQLLDALKPVKAVAKKSTSKPQPQVASVHVEPPKQPMCEDSQSSSTHSARTDRRLASNRGNDAADPGLEGPLGAFVEIDRDQFLRRESLHKTRMPLCCGPTCLRDINDDPAMYKLKNPLLIPLFYGWERQVTKQRNSLKRGICYRTPCGRIIRNLTEIDRYLVQTNSKLSIDLFCFDPILRIDVEYIPVKTFCDIKDLSYGKENVPISCVNGIDRQYPDYVEYSNQRIPAKGVQLVLDPEFLTGCDCTDGCRDRSKCRCIQLTIEATAWSSGGRDEQAGYKNRRLNEPLLTGIFECNSKCRCDSRCHNRVVQHGLTLRLQVFKTEKRGWGLRCLDDIPAGGFICIYAGQLLTDEGANEDGQQYGDEYLAELDYIETVEKTKEGYESDVPPEDDSSEEELSSSDAPAEPPDSDSTYSGERRLNKTTKRRKRRRKKGKTAAEKAEKSLAKDEQATKSKPWPDKAAGKTKSQREKTQDWLDKMPITISDDDLDNDNKEIDVTLDSDKPVETGKLDDAEKKSEVVDSKGQDAEDAEKLDIGKPEIGKMEIGKPEIGKMEIGKPEIGKMEIGKPETEKLEIGKLETEKMETEKPEIGKMEIGKLETEKMEIGKLETEKMEIGKLETEKMEIGKLEEKEEKKDVLDAKAEQKDEKDLKETTDNATGPKAADNVKTNQVEKVDEELSLLVITDPISLNVDDVDPDSDDCEEAALNKDNKPAQSLEEPDDALKRTTRSQTSRFHNLPDPKSQKPIGVPKTKQPQKINERKLYSRNFAEDGKSFVRTRHLFGEEYSYTMDAKSMGNLGRYLNHSCSPNAFVQSVFVDTHDLRFPWVAFFAFDYIRAGTELTWDYNYGVGSVPGKVLYCYCGSAECRGRLL